MQEGAEDPNNTALPESEAPGDAENQAQVQPKAEPRGVVLGFAPEFGDAWKRHPDAASVEDYGGVGTAERRW